MNTKKRYPRDLRALLEDYLGGPSTLHKFLWAIREGEEWTQPQMAKKLGISKSHVNDIEKGRKLVSPERAARFAKILGYSPERFVSLALQAYVDKSKLPYRVEVKKIA